MTKQALTTLNIANLNTPGTYAVGKPSGLSLRVRPSFTNGQLNGEIVKQWVMRYMLDGKARSMGLGSFPDVPLTKARIEADAIRKGKVLGIDPLALKAAARLTARERETLQSRRKTFDQCADSYIATHTPSWKNAKHTQQWTNTIRQYVTPLMGAVMVDEVTQGHVMDVLRPIWSTKNETAIRVRGRIESVMDWAKALGMRQGDNPAAWEGGLKELLPAISRNRRIEHHPALPYTQIGAFVTTIRAQQSMGARALEFLILTACRTNEVIGATWDEIDLEAAQWIIPAARMKAGREHRVPLSVQAVKLLRGIGITGGVVFASPRGGALSNMAMLALHKRIGRTDITPHGFRSTFRDWAGETTNHAREVIEHALAHALKDQTEAAYSRGTLMEKRRQLMQAWADRCDASDVAAGGNVIALWGAA